MAYVDVHSHLVEKQFDEDRDEVIKRAKKTGLSLIIDNGLNKESNRKVLELAKKYDIVKVALGIYPVDANKMSNQEINEELKFIEKNKDKIMAIGEVGLDLHHIDKIEKQKEVFKKIIELAKKINKPIIIHSRKAEQEVMDILEETKFKNVLMHCFGGSKKLVQEGAKRGYLFSIPPNCVFSSHFQMIIEEVNINQLLTETDSPYLGPEKGKRNEPANVIYTIKKIAEIKGFEVKEVENNIFMNYQRFF